MEEKKISELETAQLLGEYDAARIKTLKGALRASLTVMREWIKRAELNNGDINIEDVEGAKRLYNQILRAYEHD